MDPLLLKINSAIKKRPPNKLFRGWKIRGTTSILNCLTTTDSTSAITLWRYYRRTWQDLHRNPFQPATPEMYSEQLDICTSHQPVTLFKVYHHSYLFSINVIEKIITSLFIKVNEKTTNNVKVIPFFIAHAFF